MKEELCHLLWPVSLLALWIPNSSCLLMNHTVIPSLFCIFHVSLSKGSFLSKLKHVQVSPILKQNKSTLLNPTSYLLSYSLLHKVWEHRLYLLPPFPFVHLSHLLNLFKCDFCLQHSTDKTLVKVTNDLQVTISYGHFSVFILLDCLVAVGLPDTILSCFSFYSSNWSSKALSWLIFTPSVL